MSLEKIHVILQCEIVKTYNYEKNSSIPYTGSVFHDCLLPKHPAFLQQ